MEEAFKSLLRYPEDEVIKIPRETKEKKIVNILILKITHFMNIVLKSSPYLMFFFFLIKFYHHFLTECIIDNDF